MYIHYTISLLKILGNIHVHASTYTYTQTNGISIKVLYTLHIFYMICVVY